MNTVIRSLSLTLMFFFTSCVTPRCDERILEASYRIDIQNRILLVYVTNRSEKPILVEVDRFNGYHEGMVPFTITYFTRSDVIQFLRNQINLFICNVKCKLISAPQTVHIDEVRPSYYTPPIILPETFSTSLMPLDANPLKGSMTIPHSTFEFSYKFSKELEGIEIPIELIAAVDLHISYFSDDLVLNRNYRFMRRQIRYETVRAKRLLPLMTSPLSTSTIHGDRYDSSPVRRGKLSVHPQYDSTETQ